MLQNKDIETLRMLFSSHNYVMTTAELTASKLYYADIKQLLDEGLIERVRRGYYHWTQDYGESEVVIINRLLVESLNYLQKSDYHFKFNSLKNQICSFLLMFLLYTILCIHTYCNLL